MLKTLYVVAIGLLFAAFVGFGFATFYPAPKYPEQLKEPVSTTAKSPFTAQSDAEKTAQEAQEQERKNLQDQYEQANRTYNRNLSLALLAVSILVLAASLLYLSRFEVIGDGFTLGSIFLLFYGIVRSIGTEDPKFQFLTVTVGLIVLIFLSYWKFTHSRKKRTSS